VPPGLSARNAFVIRVATSELRPISYIAGKTLSFQALTKEHYYGNRTPGEGCCETQHARLASASSLFAGDRASCRQP
jgi:hypothetical protein